MCLAEVCEVVSRPESRPPQMSRRGFLRTGAAALATAPFFPGVLGGAERATAKSGDGSAGVRFT